MGGLAVVGQAGIEVDIHPCRRPFAQILGSEIGKILAAKNDALLAVQLFAVGMQRPSGKKLADRRIVRRRQRGFGASQPGEMRQIKLTRIRFMAQRFLQAFGVLPGQLHGIATLVFGAVDIAAAHAVPCVGGELKQARGLALRVF